MWLWEWAVITQLPKTPEPWPSCPSQPARFPSRPSLDKAEHGWAYDMARPIRVLHLLCRCWWSLKWLVGEGNGTHSSALAWKIPWKEEPGGLESMRSLGVRQDWELRFHFSLSCIGEGNGDPLQCPCLETPRGGGAWRAAVYGVAQSGTRLSNLRLHFQVAISNIMPDLASNKC